MLNAARCLVRRYTQLFAAVFIGLLSFNAHAANGFNLIGFGAESLLMGGADIAVARDTSALNTNPAGLSQISGQTFDIYGSLLRPVDLTHQDQFGNHAHTTNRYTALGGGGYARALENLPCKAGVGFFTQGGSNAKFDLNNAFGTQDEYSTQFNIMKFTPGIACQVNERLALGASLGLINATLKQQIFPNTLGAGIKIKDLSSLRTQLKLGLQYKARPDLTLAASYTEKTELALSGGQLRLKTGADSVANYHDVNLRGLALPREIGLGAAYQANDAWLLSLKVNWIHWSDALEKTRLSATEPDAAAPPAISSTSTFNWHNQLVLATGLAYQYDDKITLYAGYNYGKNPVPKAHTRPLAPAIFEHHVTFGGAYQYNRLWKLFGGVEYALNKGVKYTNTELPFGANSQLNNEAIWLHLQASRSW